MSTNYRRYILSLVLEISDDGIKDNESTTSGRRDKVDRNQRSNNRP